MTRTPPIDRVTPVDELRGIIATRGELVALGRKPVRARRRAARRSAARLAGNKASPFHGRGMEFAEVRAYQPGDDVRWIDWRVTARTGRVHTKLFAEERERPVWLVVDLGASMRFGTRGAFKSVLAARAAARLAWEAHSRGESVGGVVGSPAACLQLPPGRTRRHLLGLLDVLATGTEAEGDPRADFLAKELGWLRQRVRTGSRVVVLSDFYRLDEGVLGALRALAQRCEVMLVWVYDELESALPPPGRYRVSDGQTMRSVDSGRGSAWHAGVVQAFETRGRLLREFARRWRIVLAPLRTDGDESTVLEAVPRASGRAGSA